MAKARFTMDDIQKKGLKIVGGSSLEAIPPVEKQPVKKPNLWPKEKIRLMNLLPVKLSIRGIESALVAEHRFHPKRKWRFDWAYPELKIAIEYEGIFASKSRHTSINGFVNDSYKYNYATITGWKVLRYTARNCEQVFLDLSELAR